MKEYTESRKIFPEPGELLQNIGKRKINPPTGAALRESLHFALRTSLNHSFVLAGLFAVLFAIARIAGFAYSTDVHYINYVICCIVAYDSMNKSYRHKKEFLSYFSGIMVGVVTILLAHLWFAVAFFFYLLLDAPFTAFLMQQFTYIHFSPRISIAGMIFSEGAGLSVIISLFLIQLFLWRKRIDPYFDNKR